MTGVSKTAVRGRPAPGRGRREDRLQAASAGKGKAGTGSFRLQEKGREQTNKDWFKGNSSTRDMHLPRRNLGDRNGQSCCPGPVCPESPARWPEGGGQGRKQRFDPDEGLGKDSYRWFLRNSVPSYALDLDPPDMRVWWDKAPLASELLVLMLDESSLPLPPKEACQAVAS